MFAIKPVGRVESSPDAKGQVKTDPQSQKSGKMQISSLIRCSVSNCRRTRKGKSSFISILDEGEKIHNLLSSE